MPAPTTLCRVAYSRLQRRNRRNIVFESVPVPSRGVSGERKAKQLLQSRLKPAAVVLQVKQMCKGKGHSRLCVPPGPVMSLVTAALQQGNCKASRALGHHIIRHSVECQYIRAQDDSELCMHATLETGILILTSFLY
jgi:hypothetical protein